MKTFNIYCDDPWFSKLENGIKRVEGRKGTLRHRTIKAGDRIQFICTGQNRRFIAMVQKVDIFTSLNDYLNTVTLEEALPGVTAFQEGLKIYPQWSTPEEIEKHGFLGIWIKIDSIRSEPGGKTRVRRRFLA